MSKFQHRFAGLDRLRAPDLWDEIQLRANAGGTTESVTLMRAPTPIPGARTQSRSLAVLLAAAAVVLALAAGAIAVGSWRPLPSSVAPTGPIASDPVTTDPITWTGPLRAVPGEMVVLKMVFTDRGLSWLDGLDAPIAWVDISQVHFKPEGQAHWYIELADWPPPRTDPDRSALLAYGLVVESTGDDAADFVIGLEDVPGSLAPRVWVTKLATGETLEQTGDPYGYPVEFAYPVEPSLPDEQDSFGPTVVFTFLAGTPNTIRFDASTARFYAWASRTFAGQVVAWDYAPDSDWLSK